LDCEHLLTDCSQLATRNSQLVKNILIVGAGGFLGAVARYGVNLAVGAFWGREFPLATMLINISGSFILGLLATLAAERLEIDQNWRLFVATGFVGAYTTFSTFEYETHRLAETGALSLAALNVLLSVIAGLLAVHLGVMLAR
jgi:CrcB protein